MACRGGRIWFVYLMNIWECSSNSQEKNVGVNDMEGALRLEEQVEMGVGELVFGSLVEDR